MRTKYCLDTNFFVQGWNKYYSPIFCSGYWEIIDEIGKEGIIFIPEMVKNEISKIDDTLNSWLKNKPYLVKPIDSNVQKCLKDVYSSNVNHQRLVDNTKNRSQADPWVIAHAISEGATVVTKEEKIVIPNSTKIKIPNVCDNMGVRCIDDFEFIKEMKLLFTCIKPYNQN
jgi:hypothetical protein